jgi:hypothetical protein
MKTQKIDRKLILEILPTICENWKGKVAEIVINDTNLEVSVDQSLIETAYKEADSKQKKWLEKHFSLDFFNMKKSFLKFKTFQNVLESVGESLDSFNNRTQFDSISEKAFKKLKLIAKVLNEGWQPDFSNDSQQKWYIWWVFDKSKKVFVLSGCGYDSAFSSVGSHLSLKSQDIATYFATQFEDVWNEFLLIEK